MAWTYLVVLITGAVTLSLELLASRIMTPYFGVSLYIWTGILTITLIALAMGYWWGGRLSRVAGQQAPTILTFRFGLMPAASSLSLVIACLLYPKIFPALALQDMVLGAFLACCVLLLVPLVAISAMNPLLIAMSRRTDDSCSNGDGGAGLVFFISTLGSVLGVLITAFGFIPRWTNFSSVLLLAIILAITSLSIPWGVADLGGLRKRWLWSLSIAGLLLSIGLLLGRNIYLNKYAMIQMEQNTWRLVDERPSFFGNIKVVEVTSEERQNEGSDTTNSHSERKFRIYLVDGTMQSIVRSDGVSYANYTHALERLGRSYQPKAERVLVLGLAGGVLPMSFAKSGSHVDVVEIDPVSQEIAVKYFGFEPDRVSVLLTDARVFVKQNAPAYDLVFVDLFQSDAVPEHVLSAEFVRDLRNCVSTNGIVVFNSFFIPQQSYSSSYYGYLKTVSISFSDMNVYYSSVRGTKNVFLVAANRELKHPQLDLTGLPPPVHEVLSDALAKPRRVDSRVLFAAQPISDERNIFQSLNARDYVTARRNLVDRLPPELLVN